VGVLTFIASGGLFGGIGADFLTGSFLTRYDTPVAEWLHAHATPVVTNAAIAITFLGSPLFLSGASLATALFLARRRCWHALLALVLTMGGGALLISLLKNIFHRPRPIFESPRATLASYSFPSGHVMGTTLFCGLIGVIIAKAVQAWRWRVWSILVGTVFVLLVAFTRIYLGVHYLSDVLGAMAAGLAWLAFSLTAVETWGRRPTLELPR
jgi:undecaprenyl-diphosphatase